MQTFGEGALKEHGVLDVAGGQGKLSFALRNVYDVDVTVIDPRPLQLERSEKMWARGLFHKGSEVLMMVLLLVVPLLLAVAVLLLLQVLPLLPLLTLSHSLFLQVLEGYRMPPRRADQVHQDP